MPEVRRNLISVSLLSGAGYTLLFQSTKVIITEYGSFVGKNYLSDGLYVINIQNNIVDKFDFNNKFTFTTCSSSIWHARLGHFNYQNFKRMMDIEII